MGGRSLPGRFDGIKPDGTPYPEQYQILIVAEKYQTGFDQPKLCAMYVDRKLAGLQAVQTLSRLNRTRLGKDQTFILDFQNTIEDIQEAFRPYFEVTALEANSDPNLVYDLEGRLFKFAYLDKDEIERFAAIYYMGPLDGGDRARLEGLVRQAVARFESDDDEGRQEEFRQLLRSYMRFGDDAYAMEEMVAELGAAFLCGDLGITAEPRPDHAAYIDNWLRILKSDRKAIFTAASAANKAAEYLASLTTDERREAA